MPRASLIIAAVIAVVVPESSPASKAVDDRGPVTSIAAVRGMSDEEVCSRAPVMLQGIVTWLKRSADGTLRHLVLQEGEAGVWVNLQIARQEGTWRGDDALLAAVDRGTCVEVEGTTVGGGFSPMVEPTAIRVLGTDALPAPRQVDMDRFFTGAEDCLRVAVTGVVQSFSDRGNWELAVEHGGRRFVATIPRSATTDPAAALVDARVRLRGVAVGGFNTRGEIMYPRLLVDDPADVIIVALPSSPPFETQQVPLRAIAHFRPEPLDGHRLRTEGVVTFTDGDRLTYVQDGLTGVRVETVAATNVTSGDRIEIAGFLDRRRPAAGLVGCLVRVKATGVPPAPVPISLAEVVKSLRDLRDRGIMARPGDYDGCLVEFSARLIDIDRTDFGGRCAVTVEGLESPVTVVLDAATFRDTRFVEIGSDLLLRGILQFEYSALQRVAFIPPIDSVSLLVRASDDVSVIRGPAWWNARRLATAAGTLAAVLLGAGAWVFMLQRQVARQSARIAAEMKQRRDAAVEFEATLRERSRLAANLHDTLLQSLAGAVLQIDLSGKSLRSREIDRAGEQLDVAKRMVKHCVADLRSSVWSLRTAPQAGRTFGESLQATLDQFRGGETPEVALRVVGEAFSLPHFVAGNLLLVVQEAVRNAIHHGEAARVQVDVRYNPGSRRVEIGIVDDGAGFDTAAIKGPEQGHFGLQVMRERVEGLGGTFSIEARAGVGTKIAATVDVSTADIPSLTADTMPAVP